MGAPSAGRFREEIRDCPRVGSREGTAQGVREVGAWAQGRGLGPGLANGSCSPWAAVGLEDARTWSKVVAFAAPTPQQRLPRRGGQAYTAGGGRVLRSHRGLHYCRTFLQTPLGIFRNKGH